MNHLNTQKVTLEWLETQSYFDVLTFSPLLVETALKLLRWPLKNGHPVCPYCNQWDKIKLENPAIQKFRCNYLHEGEGGKGFSLKTKTVFLKSQYTNLEMLALIYAVRHQIPLKEVSAALKRNPIALEVRYQKIKNTFGGGLTFPREGENRAFTPVKQTKTPKIIRDLAAHFLKHGTRQKLSELQKIFPHVYENQLHHIYADLAFKKKPYLEKVAQGIDPYA